MRSRVQLDWTQTLRDGFARPIERPVSERYSEEISLRAFLVALTGKTSVLRFLLSRWTVLREASSKSSLIDRFSILLVVHVA
jgi:hypothetical protein